MTEHTTIDVKSEGRVRVTDAERRQAEERLRQGLAEGSLDLAEFDERTARLWQDVKTRDDLADIVGDLPVPEADLPVPVAADRVQASRTSRAVWLSVAVVNCVAWAIVFISTLVIDKHSWWSVNVTLPYIAWSALLAGPTSLFGLLWATGFGRRGRRAERGRPQG